MGNIVGTSLDTSLLISAGICTAAFLDIVCNEIVIRVNHCHRQCVYCFDDFPKGLCLLHDISSSPPMQPLF